MIKWPLHGYLTHLLPAYPRKLLFGLFFTWRSLRQARESQAQTQQETQRTLKLTEQGQITERFTRAIEHLGDENDDKEPRLEVRLGGIYALERVAKESVEHYGPIMEILASYIRVSSPWPAGDLPQGTSQDDELRAWTRWRTDTDVEMMLSAAPPDVQAILDVLVRREETRVPRSHRVSLNLSRTDLRKTNLVGINLAGSSLNHANLQDAWLPRANLEKADHSGANLQRTWLSGANFTGARMSDARLEGALLAGAEIVHPSLENLRILGLEEIEEDVIDIEPADLREAHGLDKERLALTVGELAVKLTEDIQPDTWNLTYQEQYEIIRERMKEQLKKFE